MIGLLGLEGLLKEPDRSWIYDTVFVLLVLQRGLRGAVFDFFSQDERRLETNPACLYSPLELDSGDVTLVVGLVVVEVLLALAVGGGLGLEIARGFS